MINTKTPSGFLSPEEVLENLNLKDDMLVAEFGCGSGNFTILLAQILKEGRVYGLDIQEEPLSVLRGRAAGERLSNIETIRCDLEKEGGSTLPDGFLDLVLIPNVLFQAEDKKVIIKEAARILKKNGKILIVDWKKDSSLGPKSGKISAEEVKKISQELSLRLEKEFEAGSFHYGLIFIKP